MPVPDLRQYVGIPDVVDILGTTVLIYYVLLLIRGTRAAQILSGVLVLFALLGVANLLHLLVLGSILQLVVLGAAVTLPIVFQPELRRALEQLGRGGMFRGLDLEDIGKSRGQNRSFATLAEAAFALSRERTGALIVIEQTSGLKEFTETGTALGAQLSVELLLAIFNTRSPLHDGAVIVRDGVLEAAGCLLPLAEQLLTERRLGTRHRAALGLSEQTDAVVVVVSEQTGNVAVAREGRLSRNIEDEARLIRFLAASTRAARAPSPTRKQLMAHVRTRWLARRLRRDPNVGHPQKLSP